MARGWGQEGTGEARKFVLYGMHVMCELSGTALPTQTNIFHLEALQRHPYLQNGLRHCFPNELHEQTTKVVVGLQHAGQVQGQVIN